MDKKRLKGILIGLVCTLIIYFATHWDRTKATFHKGWEAGRASAMQKK